MIKRVLDYQNDHYEIFCDSCNVMIAICCDWVYEKGQELVYSPILCESCGQKHNKDVGDDVFRLKKMEEFLIDLKPMITNLGWKNILDEYMKKHGISFKYFVEGEDSK